MIDKILKLDNGLSYYILDEYQSEEGNNYVFGVQVDVDTSSVSSNYIFLKEKNDLNDIYFDSIVDKDEYEKIGGIFIDRISN